MKANDPKIHRGDLSMSRLRQSTITTKDDVITLTDARRSTVILTLTPDVKPFNYAVVVISRDAERKAIRKLYGITSCFDFVSANKRTFVDALDDKLDSIMLKVSAVGIYYAVGDNEYFDFAKTGM